MKRNNWTTVTAISLMFAALATLPGCGTGEAAVAEGTANDDATPVPVQTASPVRADIFATYAATASIASDADAPVTARVSGEVVELLVEEGDRVTAGQALARLDGERLRLEMLSAKANLERAEKEYQRNVDLHQRGIVSAAMFEGLKYDLDALRATYELKKLNYDYSLVRATISGVISSREVKLGENVAAGQVTFRVTENTELVAYLRIPQAELAKFTVGHRAYLEVASMPGERFDATIARISPTIDARNGTFRATAIIDNRHRELAPGMFGRFTIAYEKHPDALLVPANAVVKEDSENTVYVVENDKVVQRAVTTGIESGGRIEILGGLSEGESIVVIGHSGLRDGSRVLASRTDLENFTG